MSFAEQERALFDLLFDRRVRERFHKSPLAALRDYALNDDERADFSTIRADGLALDAWLRADFVLSHLCRAFPLSFSLTSSLTDGLDLLRQLIDTRIMRTPPDERAAAFGARLRDLLVSRSFESAQVQAAVITIIEAELGMAMTACALRTTLAAGESPPAPTSALDAGWLDQPVQMAAYVSATVIPRSYPQLKSNLCACADTELWAHLSSTPLPASLRAEAFALDEPRLLLAQARVTRISACDISTEHVTMELSDGFAPLFAHVNGKTSVGEILAQMRKIGAPEGVLKGIEVGFRQLLETGMVEISHKPQATRKTVASSQSSPYVPCSL